MARSADDCNVYVRSQKAGERVMRLLRRCYDKPHLQINESRSAEASVFGRKCRSLAILRDTLIPKLLSGELSVTEAMAETVA